jgi:hypothetical protein
MAEDAFEESAKPSATADAAAMHAALGAPGASEEARDYLRKQSLLSDLQIDNLRKQDEYELSHLRWRRFNDQMKGAMQIMMVAVGLLVVMGIGATVWNASLADGLVVDAFTVPPDFRSPRYQWRCHRRRHHQQSNIHPQDRDGYLILDFR